MAFNVRSSRRWLVVFLASVAVLVSCSYRFQYAPLIYRVAYRVPALIPTAVQSVQAAETPICAMPASPAPCVPPSPVPCLTDALPSPIAVPSAGERPILPGAVNLSCAPQLTAYAPANAGAASGVCECSRVSGAGVACDHPLACPSPAPCTVADVMNDSRYDVVFEELLNGPRAVMGNILTLLGLFAAIAGVSAFEWNRRFKRKMKRQAELATIEAVQHAKKATRSVSAIRTSIMANEVAVQLWRLATALRRTEDQPAARTDAAGDGRQAHVHLDAAIGILKGAKRFDLPMIDPNDPDQGNVQRLLDNSLAYMLADKAQLLRTTPPPSYPPTVREADLKQALDLSRTVFAHRNDAELLREDPDLFDYWSDTFIFVRLVAEAELVAAREALEGWKRRAPKGRESDLARYDSWLSRLEAEYQSRLRRAAEGIPSGTVGS